MTTTYPGLFYFSFVGTCARHRKHNAATTTTKGEKEEEENAAAAASPLSSTSLSSGVGDAQPQPQSQWLTALVKGLAYRLMAWHVRGVKFVKDGKKGNGGGGGDDDDDDNEVFAMLGPEANGAAARWAEDGASDGAHH